MHSQPMPLKLKTTSGPALQQSSPHRSILQNTSKGTWANMFEEHTLNCNMKLDNTSTGCRLPFATSTSTLPCQTKRRDNLSSGQFGLYSVAKDVEATGCSHVGRCNVAHKLGSTMSPMM